MKNQTKGMQVSHLRKFILVLIHTKRHVLVVEKAHTYMISAQAQEAESVLTTLTVTTSAYVTPALLYAVETCNCAPKQKDLKDC